MITIIGNRSCSRCKVTKSILEQRQVPFEYKEIENLSEQDSDKYLSKAQEAGTMNFPIILKNNEVVSLEDILN